MVRQYEAGGVKVAYRVPRIQWFIDPAGDVTIVIEDEEPPHREVRFKIGGFLWRKMVQDTDAWKSGLNLDECSAVGGGFSTRLMEAIANVQAPQVL